MTIRGYIEIKVEEPNKWRLKHRVVWEMAHGEIPKDNVIIFKDNDKTNTDIDNLILTEKGVNATLNKTGFSGGIYAERKNRKAVRRSISE